MKVFMAAFPICHNTPYKDQSVIRHNEKRFIYDSDNMLRSFFSVPVHSHPSYKANNILVKSYTKEWNAPRCIVYGRDFLHKTVTDVIPGCYSRRENLSIVQCSTESSSIKKHLRSLDSYFGKRRDNAKSCSFDLSNKVMQEHQIDEYLGKLNNGAYQQNRLPTSYVESRSEEDNLVPRQSFSNDTIRTNFRKQTTYVDISRMKGVRSLQSTIGSPQNDDTSSLYLMQVLLLFLFEIASPIRNDDLELFSLPLLYGAKINDLIMVGEWWRLVTPMFLHAGIYHMALSCWSLLTFGPQVCRGYGSFTFFLIYILGGVSGNLTSFLHTPDPTVGGTGPVFAIIGAWLMYQIQNKDVTTNDASENLFGKAIIVTALGFILSNLGPIDDWTHFGAAFTGMAYGYLTSPTLQLDDASTGQEEGLKLVRKHGDYCKSLIIFTIFIIVLSSFLFFMDPPLHALTYEYAAALEKFV
ncbi:hypothetical protein Lal_00040289 [Lupinus albus]|nr:hypothetical protein Lal_00040289 [Lupinus albus]